MRKTALIVALAACGQTVVIVQPIVIRVEYPDAGVIDAGTEDAGTPDAGLMCEPASEFCVGTVVWQCTFNGNDALWLADCADHADGGYCASAGSCPPGKEEVAGDGFSCCAP